MLDIKYIRDNFEIVRQAAIDKGLDPTVVDKVLKLDVDRRELIGKIEALRAEKNTLTQNDQEKGKKIKLELKELEPKLRELEAEFNEQMLYVPGVPLADVPKGKNEADNQVVKTWGEVPQFKFEAKDHISLGESLDLLDLERGAKVSGFRGYFLKNEAVMMQMGLMQFALKKLIGKGFVPMIPPMVVKERALINTGHFPWGKVDVYKTFEDEKEVDVRYLAGTAEVPIVSYHQDEVLAEAELPKLYAGFSPCYRREIGSYGKDTKGVYRIHEFFKIEQVVICKNDDVEALDWHEKLLSYAEEILQDLKLPYRVLLMCTGDMGEPQKKKYDIETYMPSRKSYGETMSNSIMGDFQSRRANVRYRNKKGEVEFCQMLNNTALASPRILIAIWENYQQQDGSIEVPEVLQKYVGKKIISARSAKA